MDCVNKWNECLEIIKDNVPARTYNTWFVPIVPLQYESGVLVLQVPSQYFYEFLEEKFLDLLRKTIYKIFGSGVKLEYSVKVASDYAVIQPSSERTITSQLPSVRTAGIPESPLPEVDAHLNPNYNFDTFIEGISNKLSRSVAMAVAEKPGKTFNPLFIFGSSGVGKTHLANAIGTKVKELYPEMRVLYVSAHLFQVQYTDAVRKNTVNDFIKFYQTIDVLIIDDIQEFAGLSKTQNTFFHIFNMLHQNGKQLIMTSDRAPVLLQGMEERMISRFKWAMVAELEKPTLELRESILRYKIKRDGLKFPEEAIKYIAENVSESIRDLEGITATVMAYSTIYNREVDMSLVERIVQKFTTVENKPLTIEDIVSVVCKYYGLEEQTIQTKSRKHDVVQARQIAMYLAKKHTSYSAARIGVLIGNRDHATVLHACKTVQELADVDKKFRSDIDIIQKKLKKH